jgi:hypothetical protein
MSQPREQGIFLICCPHQPYFSTSTEILWPLLAMAAHEFLTSLFILSGPDTTTPVLGALVCIDRLSLCIQLCIISSMSRRPRQGMTSTPRAARPSRSCGSTQERCFLSWNIQTRRIFRGMAFASATVYGSSNPFINDQTSGMATAIPLPPATTIAKSLTCKNLTGDCAP